ncbi:MAG: ester cyclase [Actinomycetota bacterium]
MTSAESTNADFVKRVFEDGWNRSEFGFLDGATATQIPFHYNGSTHVVAHDSLPGLVQSWRDAFPDLTMVLRHVIAQGDLVAAALTLTGTHQGPWLDHEPSGATVSVEEMMVFRFDGGVLVEMWEVFDDAGLRSQISRPSARDS